MLLSNLDGYSALNIFIFAVITSIAYRIIYNLYFHPLAKFHGPWYTSCFSLPLAIMSVYRYEHQWLRNILEKYGSMFVIS